MSTTITAVCDTETVSGSGRAGRVTVSVGAMRRRSPVLLGRTPCHRLLERQTLHASRICNPMSDRLPDPCLDQVFRTARTRNGWSPEAVAEALIREVYDLAKMGPTSANC